MSDELVPSEGLESSPSVPEEVVEESLESTETPVETKQETAVKQALMKKYALKVNGAQKEIELDLANDGEVQKYLQKALAADEKFQEAASMRKQMEALINHLKSNPLEILMHPELGIDVKALAEQVINQEFDEMQKTPEQKEQEKLQKELATLKEQLEKEQEAKRTAEMERLREQAFSQLDMDITEALGKSTLPKSPYVVKRITDAMIDAVELGYDDIGVKDVLPFVEKQIAEEIQQMFGAMPEEVMESLIGKQNLNRMRTKRLAKAKTPPPVTPKQIKDTGEAVKASNQEKSEEKKVRFKDIFGTF